MTANEVDRAENARAWALGERLGRPLSPTGYYDARQAASWFPPFLISFA